MNTYMMAVATELGECRSELVASEAKRIEGLATLHAAVVAGEETAKELAAAEVLLKKETNRADVMKSSAEAAAVAKGLAERAKAAAEEALKKEAERANLEKLAFEETIKQLLADAEEARKALAVVEERRVEEIAQAKDEADTAAFNDAYRQIRWLGNAAFQQGWRECCDFIEAPQDDPRRSACPKFSGLPNDVPRPERFPTPSPEPVFEEEEEDEEAVEEEAPGVAPIADSASQIEVEKAQADKFIAEVLADTGLSDDYIVAPRAEVAPAQDPSTEAP